MELKRGNGLVLAGGDSVDDAVAMAVLLRPDVKIVTQKGHRTVDVLPASAALSPEARYVNHTVIQSVGRELSETFRPGRNASMVRPLALSLGTFSATAGYIKEMMPWNARGLERNEGNDITSESVPEHRFLDTPASA